MSVWKDVIVIFEFLSFIENTLDLWGDAQESHTEELESSSYHVASEVRMWYHM